MLRTILGALDTFYGCKNALTVGVNKNPDKS